MTLEFLQIYWWMIVSVLGGILVFLLFVQGGQTMLLSAPDKSWNNYIIESIGRKWELTFTTLVTFGGAAFASFPLFYSTSFGGAYWLWILILLSFVVQAVSYEYRNKRGNLYGTRTYDIFLFINGCVGCILLGVAVAMFFFGGEFTVDRSNLLDAGAPVISSWASTHGLEAICSLLNLSLGLAVLFLARILGGLYLINSVKAPAHFYTWLRKQMWVDTILFLLALVGFLTALFTQDGWTITGYTGGMADLVATPYKYFYNLIGSPATIVLFLVGVACVLLGILRTLFVKDFNKGIWFAGIGTFFVVVALFWLAGYNNTPFLPSVTDPASSLTIVNASSSKFTLQAMFYVSLLVPFVVGYIWYVWRQIDKTKVRIK